MEQNRERCRKDITRRKRECCLRDMYRKGMCRLRSLEQCRKDIIRQKGECCRKDMYQKGMCRMQSRG
ncbi:hypothetical protein IMSAGC013_02070 [Lachnospiraceae bacterium]|nr:hypothetical protein IMSAGC013_02070 [Lachnospiraceae bacterium]